MMQLSLDQAKGLCRMAALGAGANEEAAQSLTASIIAPKRRGCRQSDCRISSTISRRWKPAASTAMPTR